MRYPYNHPSSISYEIKKKRVEDLAFKMFINTISTIWESKYELWCEIEDLVPTEEGYYHFLRLYSQVGWGGEGMPCKGKKKKGKK